LYLHNTNYRHVLMLFNTFFHFGRSFASSCHSGTCNSLNSGFTRRTSLRSTAASSATSAESSANSKERGFTAKTEQEAGDCNETTHLFKAMRGLIMV
jgi:hypothetical protein